MVHAPSRVGSRVSKTPTANHRRPLPIWKRLCGRQLGQSLAKLSGQLFPESVWKDFGERVGEQEEEEGEDQEKGGGGEGGGVTQPSQLRLV